MTRRTKVLLLIAVVAVMVNLPLVHSTWTAWRVDGSGVEVVASVTDTREVGDDAYLVEFLLPRDTDPEERLWTAEVDEATYDDAVATDQVDVRVLPDRPAAHRVDGEVTSRLPLVVTVLADVLMLLALVLVWRYGGRGLGRPELVLRATGDVERCRPGAVLERLEDGRYVVAGEVCAVEADEVVLDLGDRRVRVQLLGHGNRVGYQQPARVSGHLVG
ncbi:hypothetical protein [Nocardioides sp.]|uniref:hypothetical protein n=1 Tax=Nocardioides sp. TaxID=35761 RepID=UPI0027358C69|nr:hypothetical protein [Nocardioides sp.]MDP3894787.1 hypothetical protein [Nocardioides sp.]